MLARWLYVRWRRNFPIWACVAVPSAFLSRWAVSYYLPRFYRTPSPPRELVMTLFYSNERLVFADSHLSQKASMVKFGLS